MKRSTENISSRSIKTLFASKRKSAFTHSEPPPKPSVLFLNRYSFSSSISAIGNIVQEVVEKVNSSIKSIQERKFISSMNEKVDFFSEILQSTINPFIDSPDSTIIPDCEPNIIPNDQLCIQECTIQRKKKHQKTCSNLTSPSKKQLSLKNSQKKLISCKSLKSLAAITPPSLIPLDVQDNGSQLDTKTMQLQTIYRQKFAQQALNSSANANEPESKFPSLLTAKRTKNDKDQYNFDYNGDKIAISNSLINKTNQINVLKTHYRIHKDRQQDIKNPKKVLQRYSINRLPSVHSKKLLNSSTQIHDLKANIEKEFKQKNCKLSSMKVIEENL